MSIYQDGLILRSEELMALLALNGKERFYSYLPQQEEFTEEQVWAACCTLTEAGLIRQNNGRFQLRQDLYDVIVPIVRAKRALVLREREIQPSAIFYGAGSGVVSLEAANFYGYSLSAMDEQTFLKDLMARACMRFCDAGRGADFAPTGAALDTPEERLLSEADYLLTSVDTGTGAVYGWLRGLRLNDGLWIETAGPEGVRAAEMTKEHFQEELLRLRKEGEE